MSTEVHAEMLDLQRRMQAFFDNLVVAGISEQVIATVAVTAVTERALRTASPTQTAAWLRGLALQVEKHGAAMKRELGAG